jgi:hypothetical protein
MAFTDTTNFYVYMFALAPIQNIFSHILSLGPHLNTHLHFRTSGLAL